MFRLQRALPERYADATPDQLDGVDRRGQGRRSAPAC